ncbi:MAG: carbon starvation CstA family protein [Candidatus Zipacnadales bacterium]
MNAALLTLMMVVLLYLGYWFYGRHIERRCVSADPNASTPAFALRDGVDYEPAPPLMLFGHHFTNISGAGPIVGPVIAVIYFGWAATLGWILIGAVLIGGVHDYLSLMVSARQEGHSISDIAGRLVSRRASLVFSLFLWLAMVLVIAVFGILCAKTLVSTPTVVLPNAGLLPVAMVMGWLVYRRGVPLWAASLGGAVALGLLIWGGYLCPVELPKSWGDPFPIYFGLSMLYCLIASVLPIWVLETPRDYLSSVIAIAGLLLGFVALFVAAPVVNAPAHVGVMTEKGPLWPMLFILVACGAVSGFHSIVAGGTTVKQLRQETDGLAIGFGSMMLEAALAVQVTFLVAAGLYWTGIHLGADGASLVLSEVMKAGGPNDVFIRGFASVVATAFPGISFTLGLLFGAIILNATLVDTLDTCTRLGRFVLQEAGIGYFPWLGNRWLSGLITIAPAAYLGLSGKADVIWPVFGASNQLIAALALFVVAVYLVGVHRPALYAFIPGVFMLLTTVGALLYQTYGFFTGEKPNFLLGIISVVLIVLAVYVAIEVVPRGIPQRKVPEPL